MLSWTFVPNIMGAQRMGTYANRGLVGEVWQPNLGTWKGLLHRIEKMQGTGQAIVWDETSKEGTRWRRTWSALLWRVGCFPEGKSQWVINELEVGEGCYQIYILQRPLLQMCGKGWRLENQTRDDCTGPAKRAWNFGPQSWSTKRILMGY